MNKIRIFHFITRFVKGGADDNTLITVSELNKKKYDITLGFGAEHDAEMIETANKNSVKTVVFPLKHYSMFSNVFVLFKLYFFFKKNKFDVVHTHSTEAGIIGRLAAFLAGIPVIIHTNHSIPFHQKNSLLNYFIIFCEKNISKLTSKYISNADIISEAFLNKGIGKKDQFATIYSGIDLLNFINAKKNNLLKKHNKKNQPEQAQGDLSRNAKNKYNLLHFLSNKKFKILTVSRIVEDKGLEDIIQVAEKLANNLNEKNLLFIIIGEGHLRQYLENEIAKKNLQDYFLFLGKRDDVPEVMKACDIFLICSYREGTPRVITEALACGLPVIASNIDGIPEQITNKASGILINPGDIKQISESIILLKNNAKLRKALSLNGKAKIHLFSKEIMVKKIDELYSELISKNNYKPTIPQIVVPQTSNNPQTK